MSPDPKPGLSGDSIPGALFCAADVAFTGYNARRALHSADTRMEEARFGQATALRDPARPDGYYNRVIGMGQGDRTQLAKMQAWYGELDLPCRITLGPTDSQLSQTLGEQGFIAESQDAFLALPCDEVEEPERRIEIRLATSMDLDHVFDLWQSPGDPRVDDPVRDRRRSAQMDPSFRIYLAHLDQRPVAMATTFSHRGLAWLGNASTLVDFRGRGCQSALLRRRMWDARECGSKWVLTDAERGSTSYRNAERAGLRPSFVTTTFSDRST